MVKAQEVKFVIITGISGAGKSEAVHCYEDLGYFCIDNLPPQLIPKMAEMCILPGSKIGKVAVVSDIRGREFFSEFFSALEELREKKINYKILFLEASDEALVKRFKETRRRHPLFKEGAILDGITRERELLHDIKAASDTVVDTSTFTAAQLREHLRSAIVGKRQKSGLIITVYSFGFKYGIPLDADIVMDVRFLPNPHYIDELRDLDGEHRPVKDFVLKNRTSKAFLRKFFALLDLVIPQYVEEGKSHLAIAIGCTGGMHRSVVLASETARHLKDLHYNVMVRHRDRRLRTEDTDLQP